MITVVAGLPRSGTSMSMMMLDKGGIPAVHNPNIHQDINPYGSFEIGTMEWDLTKYNDKCVKALLPQVFAETPVGDYKIIMPVRDAEQIVLSRIVVFKTKNPTSAGIDKQKEQIERAYRFLKFVILARTDMQLLEIPYKDFFEKKQKVVDDVSNFLGVPFNKEEAVKAVDSEYFVIRTREEVLPKTVPPTEGEII